MRRAYTFENHLMAAVFTAAVVANHEDINSDNIDGCELGDPSVRTVVIEDENEVLYINTDTPQAYETKVRTLAELELAIGEALTLRADCGGEDENPSRVLFRTDAGKGDNPLNDFNIRIRADGTVRVGCKEFTKDGVERVVKAANQMVKDGDFEGFFIEDDDAEKYEHHVQPYTDNGRLLLDFDHGDGYADAANVIKIGKLRDRILGKLSAKDRQAKEPARKVEPFRIFPVQAKAKSKTKARARKRKR